MELGNKLKEAREAKKLSLEDLQQLTKIQKRYLNAIEQGDYSIMPGKFYTRAFVRQYAEAVDLDPDNIMEEFKSELPSAQDEEYVQLTRTQSHRSNSSVKSSAFLSVLPKIMTFILIIGIVVVAWYFFQQRSNEPNEDVQSPDDQSGIVYQNNGENGNLDNTDTQAENQEPADNPEPAPEPEPEPPKGPELTFVDKQDGNPPLSTYDLIRPDGLKLHFEVNGECYLAVKNAKGKSFLDKMVTTKTSPIDVELTGEQEAIITIGKASDLQFTVDGVPFKYEIDPNKTVFQKVRINLKSPTE